MKTIPSAPKYAAREDGMIVNTETGLVLKPQNGRRGYFTLRIKHADGKMRTRYIHHLVAEAFIGFRPDGADIDHIDGNRKNNRADNLRYCSRRENQDNPANHGKNGWQEYASRKVWAFKNGTATLFENASTAAKQLGLCLSGISNALSGKPANKGYKHGKPYFLLVTQVGGYTFAWADGAKSKQTKRTNLAETTEP